MPMFTVEEKSENEVKAECHDEEMKT